MENLIKLKEEYVTIEADKIVADMVKYDRFQTSISTCDMLGYGWDRKLHRTMPLIAERLREKGFSVTSSVNHGVTDWVITIN